MIASLSTIANSAAPHNMSCVFNDKHAFVTEKKSTRYYAVDALGNWMPKQISAVPRVVARAINNKHFRAFSVIGSVAKFPPVLPTNEKVAAKLVPTPIVGIKSNKRILPNKRTYATKGNNMSQHSTTPVKTANISSQELTGTDTTKLSVAELLAQCSDVIKELSGHITTAQVECYTLDHYTGSTYRSGKARAQLVAAGLVVKVGRGYQFTGKGLELNLGTFTRKPNSDMQVLRYSPEVTKYFNLGKCDKNVPFSVPTFNIVDPVGKVHTVNVVRDFCNVHGLNKAKIYMLRKQTITSHKGWTLQA